MTRSRDALAAVLLAVALTSVATGTAAGSGPGPAAAVVGQSTTGAHEGAATAGNETRIRQSGDALTLAAGPGQAVWGRTDMRPGSVVTVRVQSTDDGDFLRSTTATVGADGLFRAVVDLSELRAGDPLRVVVHHDGDTLAATGVDVVDCSFCPPATPATPSGVVLYDGASLSVRDAPGQVVRVRTNLQPGASVTVRLRSSSGASPFIKSTAATVDANGSARAVFDFDDVPQGTDFRVAVVHNGTELTTAQGDVACRGACGSTATPGGVDAFDGADVGVVQAANGSVARVILDLGSAEAALLTVRSPSTSYELAATVDDGNGDGEVVVRFDTAAAARDGAPLSAAGARDRVRVREERGRFGATDYRLALHPPDDEETEVATGLLVVTQNGSAGTPLLTGTPGPGGSLPVGSAAALVVGAALAVLGVGLVLGLVDPEVVLDRL